MKFPFIKITGKSFQNCLMNSLQLTAFLPVIDLIAATVITEAKKRRKDIPGQLKVIGYDGTEAVAVHSPELTTIQQPIELISKTAIEILSKAIEGEFDDLPLETYLPVQLLEGETT